MIAWLKEEVCHLTLEDAGEGTALCIERAKKGREAGVTRSKVIVAAL